MCIWDKAQVFIDCMSVLLLRLLLLCSHVYMGEGRDVHNLPKCITINMFCTDCAFVSVYAYSYFFINIFVGVCACICVYAYSCVLEPMCMYIRARMNMHHTFT